MTITAEDLVHREVLAYVSHLVSTLAQGYGAVAGHALPRNSGRLELADLTEQAFDLACPIDDWRETAEQAGWSVIHHTGAGWRAVKNEAATDEDVTLYAASVDEAWQDACEHDNLEPYQREVFEHWIVSSWLANKLEAHGEKVDRDFAGLTVWARTTTGQAISMDSVIERIHAGLIAGA